MKYTLASPTDNIHCCCNEETQKYRGFSITWNTTIVNETVVVECKGDGIKGRCKSRCIKKYLTIYR